MEYIAIVLFILGCFCLLISKFKEWGYFLEFLNQNRSVNDAYQAKFGFWFTSPFLDILGTGLIIIAAYLFLNKFF